MLHRLTNHSVQMAVDAGQGGRIHTFSLDGQNALFTGEPQWGSTFWPSPQQAWGWPPPAVLDSNPYHRVSTAPNLTLQSAPCGETGLQLTKIFKAVGQGFQVTYRMHNASDKPLHYAPWEISRVAGGITFFACSGTPEPQSTLALEKHWDCYWHEYAVATQADNLKAFANGSRGWLANAHNGLLLLKRFEPVALAEVAPSEAEIEIYAHGDAQQPYIEIEQQGPYVTLAPAQALDWSVQWEVYKIPAHIPVAMGSQALYHWVTQLVSQTHP